MVEFDYYLKVAVTIILKCFIIGVVVPAIYAEFYVLSKVTLMG